MKKWLSMFLVTVCVFLLSHQTFAYDGTPLVRVNYLDLSKLEYNYAIEGSARTTESIILKPDSTYTLVMSQGFLGRTWDYIDMTYVEIEESSGSLYYYELLSVDVMNQRAYFTFETQEGHIDLCNIPVDGQVNYEIILYEGEYADFPGFSPYVDENDPLNYYGVLPIDYDSQPTLAMIQSYVIAKNPFGGTISSAIVFDTYTISSKLPGTYQMVFEATYHDILKRYYLDINVYDLKAPELSIGEILQIPLMEKWTIDEIKQQVTITDNVDTLNWTDLVVTNDTYSDATSLGNYQVSFSATDEAGNTGIIDVDIQLIDRTGPQINGPSAIYIYTTDQALSNAEIQSKFTFIDDIDQSNVTVSIITNEYQQTVTPGRYRVTFKALDQMLNESQFNVFIHVIENRGPVFEQTEMIIEKTTADAMSESEIIDWLKNQLELSGYHATNFTVLYNEYESHEKEKGSYYVYMSYEIDGQEMTSRVLIDVEKKPISWLWIVIPSSTLLSIGVGAFFLMKHKKIKY
jgi:hypothetical protein